ncbi:MAG: DPP IV N-terminal domain-containing protein, partial [Acidobacteriota bacterium]
FFFVLVASAFLMLLAGGGIAWGAPSLQGTIPEPPGTPVPPGPTPSPGLGGCCLPGVVFTSMRDGNSEIYVMKTDGSGLLRLTNNPAVDEQPAASMDGTRIVFSSNRDDPDFVNCGKPGKPNCRSNLYVMMVDGSNVKRLTFGPGQDTHPVWSMSGVGIAFTSTLDDPDPTTCGQPGRPACVRNVYLLSSDGFSLIRLTPSVPGKPLVSNWDATWAPDDSRLAFVSDRDGNEEIYTINNDGSGLTRLTNNPAADSHPGWSPDGKQLVFETNRDGRYQLYQMNADGSGVKRLMTDSADDRYPVWIPGCFDRIVFASNRDGGVFRIYAVDPDGSNPIRLTTLPAGSTAADLYPYWSGLPETWRPKGACCVPGITFDSLRDGNEEIYLMRFDGSKLTRLTNNPARDMRPAPSPDGNRIAFESNRDGHFQVYVMMVDSFGTTRLTNSSGDDRQAAWSNDAKRIAFISNRDGNDQVYVMNADGSGVKRLTSISAGADASPAWSPDSARILFQSNRDGNDEIYIMNTDGTGVTRLTNNPASDGHPSISPDGKRIAFESNRDGRYQVYAMNPDGSDVKRLTDAGENRRPYWCPSCDDRIVFASNRDGAAFSIYGMNGDGSNQIRLTTPPAGVTAPDDNPEWSGLPIRLPLPVSLPGLRAPGPGGG